ncbi:MAG: restriction endonuclease subunit S [Aestuariivita sp.]|nr:restriction endonuclease subunit S [Aestuariivita sp.]
MLAKDQFDHRVASSNVTTYKVVKRGQYAFNPSRINVGSIARLDDWENGILSPMYAVFRIHDKKIYSNYFLHWLSTFQAKQGIRQKIKGSVRETVDIKSFMSLAILLPIIAEQQKIASCLSSLDDLITAQEDKLAALREHKKGLMQQLFPRPGETVPRLRFPEFGDADGYKKRSLFDFVYEVSTRNRLNEFHRILSVTNHKGFVLAKDQFDHRVASSNVTTYKVVKRGQYAFNPSRINVGSIARLDDWENGILSPMYAVFRIHDKKIYSNYFLHWLSTFQAKQGIRQKIKGSVRETVDIKSFMSLAILLPIIAEQQKIASCLSSLDNLITAQEDKLAGLREHKKGLMQQLFPSLENH